MSMIPLSNKRKLLLAASALLCIWDDVVALTTLLKSDPYPVYTSLDPQTYLYTRKKLMLKGFDVQPDNQERLGVYLSPFGQNADIGKNMQGRCTELGDLNGKWNMLALLYGDVPKGQMQAPLLKQADEMIFNRESFPDGSLNNPDYIDQMEKVGFFSIPMAYRKRGLRFEVDFYIAHDIGINIQSGVTDICQTHTLFFNDLTPNGCITAPESEDWDGNSCCATAITKCNINKYLMDQIKPIAEEIHLNIGNFHAVSMEDLRFNAFWRHGYEINRYNEDWPEFLFIPFAQISVSAAPGRPLSSRDAFGVAFGNNRHGSAGFQAGMNFDFYDTIEIGWEADYTHFFKRNNVSMRVPTSPCQTGIYPYCTSVNVRPGANWMFGAKIAAYHFLDRLSGYFQYMIIEHKHDHICLVVPDDAFLPKVLEHRSDWKVQLANVGFNYDISPNFCLGFLWQAPISQRNVYKSSTVMFSVNMTY